MASDSDSDEEERNQYNTFSDLEERDYAGNDRSECPLCNHGFEVGEDDMEGVLHFLWGYHLSKRHFQQFFACQCNVCHKQFYMLDWCKKQKLTGGKSHCCMSDYDWCIVLRDPAKKALSLFYEERVAAALQHWVDWSKLHFLDRPAKKTEVAKKMQSQSDSFKTYYINSQK